MLFEKAKEMYDSRAELLMEQHPLGLQINLSTGVANGVLVARKIEQCAKLLRAILLNELEFEIEESTSSPGSAILREKETKSVYRLVTEDHI